MEIKNKYRGKRKYSWAPNVASVCKILSSEYHDFTHYNKKNPLDELLFIICSLQTDERGYHSTYRALKLAFPKHLELTSVSESIIADTIVQGGLSKQKAHTIKGIMLEIIQRFKKLSLSGLRYLDNIQCEEILLSLPGVGKKTARCVMMYSLGHQVFPVDTHCWRISRRLGWVRPTRPNGSCSPRDMDRLQGKIPPDIRFSLHVNMISFGRKICIAGMPKCNLCPIFNFCKRIGIPA